MLVQAHYQQQHGAEADLREEAKLAKRALWEKFERQQGGPIRNSYLCMRVHGGVATVGDRATSELHTVLNSSNATLVTLEATCNVLADQVRTAFSSSGQPQQTGRLIDAIYSATARVLEAADLPDDTTADVRAAEVAAAQAEVEHVAKRTGEAIQRQARFVY